MSTPASTSTSPLTPTSSNITELAAFTCHTYLDKNEWKEKEKITAVAICDNNVYLGFDTGTVCLYTYQISGDTDEEKSSPPVCIVKKRISKKPITSLHLIPIHEQLLIISDSTLTIHEPITLSKKENVMSNTKHTSNVQMVCVDIKSPHSLCIAPKGKRKLHLYSYSTTSRVYTSLRELMIPDTIVTMSWCGKWLICGYKKEYILMNAETGDVKDVPVPVGDATPNICLPSHHEMLLSTNELGVFMDFHGNPVPKSPIIWSKSPLTMEICSHYVIGILPSGTIEVISVLDARVVQRINMKDGKIMSTWDNQVIVASSQEVTLLRLTSLSDQIHQYLSLTLVDEAYTLLERTHPNQQQLNQFHIDAGFVLLEDLAFHDVMKHWCQTTLDPREWMILFPDLLIKGMPYQSTHPRHPHGTIQTLIDTSKKRIALNEQKRHKSIMSMTQAQLIRQARFQLAVYLWKRRTQTTKEPSNSDIWIAVDTALLFLCVEFGEEMMADDGTTERVLRGGSVDDEEDPDPSSSTHELPFTLEQLLLPSNTCLLTECETFLMKRRQYNALAVLYQSKNMMRKALEVWSRLGSGEFTETENAIIGHTRSTTRLSLNHTETSKKPVEINGVRQTVMLLSTLQDTPLLWEFAEWVLARDPKQGIKIFTSTSRDNPLPPEKVLHYLKQKQGTKPTEFDLIEAYLEHLIDVEGTRDPKYHNQLALSYFKKVAGLQLPQMKTSTSSAPSSSTPSTTPSTSKRIRPGDEPGLLGLTRGKLYAFLISSHSYTPQELLPHALPTQLWEEICILYGRMNAHIDVLKIYIFQLYDDYAAATYCLDYIKNHPPTITVDSNIAVDPDDEQSHPTDVFIDLLQLMFTSEYTSMYDDHMSRITSYLQHYHRYMNPVKVMWIIPDHVSVASLMHYFTAVLPHNTHVKRHSQIIKNVSKMNHLKVQDRVMTHRSAVFPIDPASRCYVCNKPLGDSILSIHPVPPAPLLTIKHHSHQKPSALSQQVRQSMLEQDTRIPKYRVLHYQCASTYRPDVSPNPGSLKVGSLATSTSFGRSPPRADSLDGLDPDIVARRARNNTSYLA